jgi:glucose/arabinose dehydrogenase
MDEEGGGLRHRYTEKRTNERSKVALKLVADGFVSPVAMADPVDGTGRLFVADQTGKVRILSARGELLERPFLDIHDRLPPLDPEYDERGLLGMAFHPGFRDNQKFYVYYSAKPRKGGPKDFDHLNRLSEFVTSVDPDIADHADERVVLESPHPYSNHNGGDIHFGPDGYLYIPIGDGGNKSDRGRGHNPDIGNAQDLSSLLGKILRIDVDHGRPYGIPEDNPFARTGERQEIYAYGLRNPWRISFDREGDNELFVGDVGQYRTEEVDIIVNGGNYGWNIKEGSHCYNPVSPRQVKGACINEGYRGEELIDPILEYLNADVQGGIGHAIIGGAVYRGSDLRELQGSYIFGDWSAQFNRGDGTLFVARRGQDGWEMEELAVAKRPHGRLGEYVLSFGLDHSGEMYVLTSEEEGPTGSTGKVYRLTPPV